jgi:hypothetical protein
MAGTVIGTADWQLRADQSGLVTDLKDAEGKVAASGERVEKSAIGVGTAFKTAGAVAAVGFGVMTKGTQDMEHAQGAFVQATGRSREEAIAFSKDMNGLVGTSATVNQSFEAIYDTGANVAKQFGLTGKANQDMTDDFLMFAKVTKQDAVGAVDDFDAALDAWHEPAERATSLMDQLVASNQKYGTDAGPEAVAAIKDMAPALQAMGENLDYGVGLLNLMESAGGDANDAVKGLTAVIDKFPPGTTFDDVVAKLGGIEDQEARTRAAIEIFGKKIGPGLANAIQSGMTSLEDFIVLGDEVTGQTQKTGEAMDTTGDKAKMFAQKAVAALRDVGQQVGPLVSGIGTIASAFIALPDEISKPLVDGFKGIWDKLKSSGPVQTAIAAAGAVVGPIYRGAMKVAEAVGDALGTAWDAAKTVGRSAIDAAGAAAGALYAGAMKIGQAIADGLGTAWDLAKGLTEAVIDRVGKAAGVIYAAAAFVGQRLADAAEVAWDFVAGAVEGAVKKAGGVVGKLFGESLTDNIVATTVGAAGTIIGNLSAQLITAVTTSWDKVIVWLQQGVTGGVIAKAGALQGAIFAGATEITEALVSAIGGAWKTITSAAQGFYRYIIDAGIAHGGAYAGAALATEKFVTFIGDMWRVISTSAVALREAALAGGVAGRVWGLAFAGAAVLAVPLLAKELGDKAYDALQGVLGGMTRADFQAQLDAKMAQAGAQAGTTLGNTAADAANQSLMDKPILGPPVPPGWLDGARTVGTEVGGAVADGFGQFDLTQPFTSIFGPLKALGVNLGSEGGAALGKSYVETAASTIENSAGGAFGAVSDEWRAVAANTARVTTNALTDGLISGVPSIRDAWKQYIQATKDTLDPMKQIAWLEARLSGDKLAAGLGSKNPLVRRQAELIRDTMIAQLDDLKSLAGIEGEQGGEAYGDELGSGKNKGNARTNASELADAAKNGLDRPWGAWGAAAGREWAGAIASGISAKTEFIERKVDSLLGDIMRGLSPPKKGPLHHVDKWGEGVGAAWAEGIAGGVGRSVGRVRASLSAIAGAMALTPSAGAFGFAMPALAPVGGGGIDGGVVASRPIIIQPQINVGVLVADDAGLRRLSGELERVARHWTR